MAHLSVATVIEKNKIASVVAFIPLLEIDVTDALDAYVETLYYCNNPEDITFQGQVYLKAAFSMDFKRSSSEMGEMTVNIKDYTRAIRSRMENFSGGVGFVVRVIVVNTGNLLQPAEIAEEFKVTRARAKGPDISFTLGAENPLILRFPRRNQSRDRCLWRYKGTECGYVGAITTCDYTLQGPNGCATHENTRRYGAFPGVRNAT